MTLHLSQTSLLPFVTQSVVCVTIQPRPTAYIFRKPSRIIAVSMSRHWIWSLLDRVEPKLKREMHHKNSDRVKRAHYDRPKLKSTSLIRHRVDGIQLTLTILRRRNHTRLHAFTPGVLKFVVARTSALLEPRSALATTAGFTFDLTTLGTL